jgi:uncharacterized protein (UPF0333 family)
MRAQAAFEYMLVTMIVLAFMIPVWVYSNTISAETSTELSLTYAKNAVERLATTSDLIYSQGEGARTKVNVYIPSGVEGYNFTNNTINLIMSYEDSLTDVFAYTRAMVNGTLPTSEGSYWFVVRAIEDGIYDVQIEEA